MLQLTCLVGRLRPTIDLPFPLTLMNRTMQQYFRVGSMDEGGTAHINMVNDGSRFDESIIGADRPTNAVYLQTALSRLTGNPLNAQQVDRVGLIIADRYEHRPELLGLMFDYGFNPPGVNPVGEKFTSVPREGCAIFLNAIRDIRGIDSDFRREVVFTAIHELGHVFNLGHISNPVNFMSTSSRSAVYPPSAYFFHGSHNRKLQRAEIDESVYPGGSTYDEGGPAANAVNDPFTVGRAHKDLSLKIRAHQNEFWYFEPVELDITISAKNKDYELEDKVDPGYENLVIHITKPDGTIFKYRSPRIYCQNPHSIIVKPGHPFRRDVSIFGQSGGYTFSEPGEYKIRAVFQSGNKIKLVSNTQAVYVKERKPSHQQFLYAESLLTKQDTAKLLYHRSGRYRKAAVAALEEFSSRQSRTELGNNISYALAKFITHKNRKLNSKELGKLDHIIKKIEDGGKLSPNRLKNLQKIEEQL